MVFQVNLRLATTIAGSHTNPAVITNSASGPTSVIRPVTVGKSVFASNHRNAKAIPFTPSSQVVTNSVSNVPRPSNPMLSREIFFRRSGGEIYFLAMIEPLPKFIFAV